MERGYRREMDRGIACLLDDLGKRIAGCFDSDVVSKQSCSDMREKFTKMIDEDTRGMIGHRKWRGWEGLRLGREPGFWNQVLASFGSATNLSPHMACPIGPTSHRNAGKTSPD